jgi:2-oxoisovalerate ferredoxin oxidoreductase beta subunit
MGAPLRMAEMIAQLDGPVYVERVALFDAKQRGRAARAIRKALSLQVEGKGFAFVEVLAECPTHLGKTPAEAERWVEEKMLPVFPLGVKKDVTDPTPWRWSTPGFDPETLLAVSGASGAPVPRFASGLPPALGGEVGLKFAGAGGDGAQSAAALVARAAINEGCDATHIPSYGPESRGGTSYADVHVAEQEVLAPDVPSPQALVAFNAPSLTRFAPAVAQGGVIVYDSSVIREPPATDPSIRVVGVPCSEIAHDLGRSIVKNTVALGALQVATGLFPPDTFLAAIRQTLRTDNAIVALNDEAFRRGMRAAENAPASGGWFDWWS